MNPSHKKNLLIRRKNKLNKRRNDVKSPLNPRQMARLEELNGMKLN